MQRFIRRHVLLRPVGLGAFLLVAVLWATISCQPAGAECQSDADCPSAERCVRAGGVLVSGGVCASETTLRDDADVERRDTDAETGSEPDSSDANGADTDPDTCTPTAERCNDLDDDCDGEVDEPKTCSTTGVCDGETVTCRRGSYQSCESQYGEAYASNETTVDDKDNDCDGKTDEVFERVELHRENLACGLTTSQSVYCWGKNTAHMSKSFPIDDRTYEDLAVGIKYACALSANGEVTCWGKTFTESPIAEPSPTNFVAISGTQSAACGATKKGDVFCWSDRAETQVGPSSPNAGTIEISYEAHCGLYGRSRRAECWAPRSSSLPNSNLVKNEPTTDPYVDIDVAAGRFGCAVERGSGAAECWGAMGAISPNPPPSNGFSEVSVSSVAKSFYACGITNDSRELRCWGDIRSDLYRPPEGEFSQLDLGTSGSACAVARDGTVSCWGGVTGP